MFERIVLRNVNHSLTSQIPTMFVSTLKIGLVVMEIVDSNDILFSKFVGTIGGEGVNGIDLGGGSCADNCRKW